MNQRATTWEHKVFFPKNTNKLINFQIQYTVTIQGKISLISDLSDSTLLGMNRPCVSFCCMDLAVPLLYRSGCTLAVRIRPYSFLLRGSITPACLPCFWSITLLLIESTLSLGTSNTFLILMLIHEKYWEIISAIRSRSWSMARTYSFDKIT